MFNGCMSDNEFINAAWEGNLQKVQQYLNQANANVNAANQSGSTALIQAASNGYTEIVNALIKANANVDAASQSGYTALICAADKGHTDIVNALIKANSNVDAASQFGYTPLMYAGYTGHTHIVNALIKANAHVDAVDKEGNSALMHALRGQKYDTAKWLIENGADITIKNIKGETAKTINQNMAIAALLNDEDKPENKLKALEKTREKQVTKKYKSLEEKQKATQAMSDLSLRNILNSMRFIRDNLQTISDITLLKGVLWEFSLLLAELSVGYQEEVKVEFTKIVDQLMFVAAKMGAEDAKRLVSNFKFVVSQQPGQVEEKKSTSVVPFSKFASSSLPSRDVRSLDDASPIRKKSN